MTDYQSAQIEAAQDFHDHEMATETSRDRKFSRFVSQAERALFLKVRPSGGGGLDGDEWIDGYSIDGAYAAFQDGETVADYVTGVMESEEFRLGYDKVSQETGIHERDHSNTAGPSHGMRSWRQIVRNRVAFNHDTRSQFSGAGGERGSWGPLIRAQLWHAVY